MAKEKEEVCEHPLCDSGLRLALFFILIIMVGGVLFALFSPRAAELNVAVPPAPERDLIYASGTAMREVSPDLLQLSLGVETQEETAAASQSANGAAINAVKASLLANGVLEEDIQTSQYSVYPVTRSRKVCPAEKQFCEDWEATWVDEIIGYKTTHMLAVKSTSLDSAGALVDAAVRSGANRVDSVTFTLKDETMKTIKDSLVAEAMRDAKGQAQRIASGLGVSVGKVAYASVNQFYYPIVRAYPEYAMDAAAGGTGMSPGQLTISISATVNFEIEQ